MDPATTDPVRGWEAFGSVTDGHRPPSPTIRRIGATRLDPDPDDDDFEDFHPDELHHGIATIDVSSTGGRPDTVFIKISGPARDVVAQHWDQLAAHFANGGTDGWWTG